MSSVSNLETLRQVGNNIVQTYDDTMDSKTDIIRWVNSRMNASRKEAFTSADTAHSRNVRQTERLLDEYEDLYESNDTTYTNQRKMEFHLQSYERLRSWRWVLFIPYYIVFAAIVLYGRAHYAVLALYATLPFWVDWLVELLQWLWKTTYEVLLG